MALSNELISQFVKLTNDDKENKPSNTVYGTVVEFEGEKYVRIDGSERLTRASQITDTKVNDRVIVTIENHTATVTGNISSPSASSDRVEELGGNVEKVGILLAGKVNTEDLIANYAKITDLQAETGRIDSLIATNVVVEQRLDAAEANFVNLDATYAKIDELNAAKAKIDELEAEDAEIINLFSNYATIESLDVANAKIGALEAEDADIRKLFVNYATIAKLDAEYVKSSILTANYATIVSLNAVDAKIGALDTRVANINTLTSEFISGNTVHTNFANAVIAQLGNAQIESSMIKDLTGHTITASQITSGDIITDNVNVRSEDGLLLISDQTIQISSVVLDEEGNEVLDEDENVVRRVRVQIGRDASNDYSINIWDANGKLMFSEGGLTEDAVKKQIIRNDMVKDDANISASKLDINSLFDVINDDENTRTIKSTKVYLDEEGQTLSAKFQSITTKIDGISVGGRNLLLNTGRDGVIRLNTVDAARYLPTVKQTNIGGLLTLDCSTDYLTEPEEIYYRFMAPIMPNDGDDMYGLEPGQTYTLSGKAKVSTTSGTLTRVVARTEDRVGGWGNHDVKTTITETDSEEWIPFASAFTIQENAKNCYTSIQVYYEGSWTGVIQLKDLKFEKGSLATDWTPAPEDIDAVTSDLSTKYHNLTVDIDEFESNIVTNTQNIGALTTNYSTLEQKVGEFNLTLASYTTKLDNIVGRNLLKNTKAFTGITGHNVNSSLTGETYRGLAIRYLNCTDLPGDYLELAQWSQSIEAEGNGQYTFSFYAKGTKIRTHFYDGAFKVVYCESSQGTVKTTAPDGAMDFDLTDEWARYWVVYRVEEENTTTKTTPKNVLFRVMCGEEAYVCGAKFEKGDKATDWSSAPEDVDAVTAQVAEFSATLEGFETRVSKTETDISNISDEGRNLLINTGQNGTIKLNAASDVEVSTIEYSNNNGLLRLSGCIMADWVTGEKPEAYYCFMPRVTTPENMYGLKKGGTYTFSGKLCVFSDEGALTLVKARFQDFIDSWGNDTDTVITQTDSSEWVSFKHTFTIRENATCCCIFIQLYCSGDIWSGEINLKDLKLEKGDTATDWTPAPEDAVYGIIDEVYGAIASSAETLTKQTETLLGSYAKKTELPTMSNYYTKFETKTAIEQNANSITSTVASTYSTKDETKAEIATLGNETKAEIAALGNETKAEIAALEVGGRNLLLNTGGGEPIVMSNGATKAMSGVNSVTNVNGVQTLNVLAADREIYYRFMQPTHTSLWGIEPGQTYTFSGKVKMTTAGGAFGRLSVRTQRSTGAGWSGGHLSTILTSDSSEWVEFVSTFTVESDAVGYYISLQVYYPSATNDATDGFWDGVIQLKELKLEKGDKATDWTPAPEDITTEFGNVRSEIKQLADSITLSVTGTLGQSATITLSANGTDTAQTIDLSGVRKAFVNDKTAIVISAGTITFDSNTLLINSSKFTLDGNGVITASGGTIGSMTLWSDGIYTGYHNNTDYKNACCGLLKYSNTTGGGISIFAGSNNRTGVDAKFYVKYTGELYAANADISGTVTTTDGTRKAILNGDGLSLYHNEKLCGTISSEMYEGSTVGRFAMILPQNQIMVFGKKSNAGGLSPIAGIFARPSDVDYNREERNTYENFFIGATYFENEAYFKYRTTHNNWMYIKNQNGIGWYDSDGDQEHMIHMDSDDTLYVGSTSYDTKINGNNVFINTRSKGTDRGFVTITGDNDVRVKSTSGAVELQSGSDTNDYALIFDGVTYTSYRYFYPSKNGNFYLGSSANRWYHLYLTSSSNITSDIRLKKNIVGLSDEHSELFDRLKPVQYNMIRDDDNRLHYGFIAQQISSAMAELGIGEDELDVVRHEYWVDKETNELCDEYGLVYDNFIAMLVHEVQKLKREIKTLKGE